MSGRVEIVRSDLAERLQAVGKGQVPAIEIILTEAKLDTIVELAKPGPSFTANSFTRSSQ